MVTLTQHVIPGPDLHCAGPLALGGFLQHLPAKYKCQVKTKKSHIFCAQGLDAVPYGKSGAGYCITFIKSLDEGPELAIFRTKTLDFILVLRLNWLE